MEAGLDGPEREAKLIGHLRQAEADVMVKHEDRRMLGRKASKSALELVAIGNGGNRVPTSRSAERKEPDVGRPAAALLRLRVARIDQQAAEPRVESVAVTEVGQLAPCGHQGLLDRVLGTMLVAQDPEGDRHQPVTDQSREVGERFFIASFRQVNESSLHPGDLRSERPIWTLHPQ